MFIQNSISIYNLGQKLWREFVIIVQMTSLLSPPSMFKVKVNSNTCNSTLIGGKRDDQQIRKNTPFFRFLRHLFLSTFVDPHMIHTRFTHDLNGQENDNTNITYHHHTCLYIKKGHSPLFKNLKIKHLISKLFLFFYLGD